MRQTPHSRLTKLECPEIESRVVFEQESRRPGRLDLKYIA